MQQIVYKDHGRSSNKCLSILEGLSIIVSIPAWDSNRIKRLTKSPKVHLVDPGMAAHLLNVDAVALGAHPDLVGSFFETFVVAELVTHCVTAEVETTVSHLRTRDQQEVDIVLERPGAVVGLEVKSATSVHKNDAKGLRWFKAKLGGTFKFGAVLYTGKIPYRMEDNIWALPFSSLWEPPET